MTRPESRTRRRMTRPHRRKYRPRWSVDPVIPLRVPGIGTVVIVPIAADTERDDADADQGAEGEHGNVVALVGINDVLRVHPSPVGTGHDVTPPVVADAARDRYRDAAPQYGHDGVIPGRSRPQIDVFRRIRHVLCIRSHGHCSQRCRHKTQRFDIFHFMPHSVRSNPLGA